MADKKKRKMKMTYEEYRQKVWDLCTEWGTAKAYPEGLKEAFEYFEESDTIRHYYERGILPENFGLDEGIVLCIESPEDREDRGEDREGEDRQNAGLKDAEDKDEDDDDLSEERWAEELEKTATRMKDSVKKADVPADGCEECEEEEEPKEKRKPKDFSDLYEECEEAKAMPESDKKKIWDCIYAACLRDEENEEDARISAKNLYAHCMSKPEAIEDILELAENDGKIKGLRKKADSYTIWELIVYADA